jgi:hypothetical protein
VARFGVLALLLALVGAPSCEARAEAPAIPPENQAAGGAPPPRPDAASAQEVGRRIFDAIVHGDPALATEAFFPREAFLLVKAMPQPERYWARLAARFAADVRALHAATPDLARAAYVRLAFSGRGGWVRPGEEGNRLPYWAARHARLEYRVDGAPRSIEVRVLINWGVRWYVIHLSEFH